MIKYISCVVLCLFMAVSSYALTTTSEVVCWGSASADSLASFTTTNDDTSLAYKVTPDMSFRFQVTSSNDSTNIVVYPIFSDYPYGTLFEPQKQTGPRSTKIPVATFTDIWAESDSADYDETTANGWGDGQDMSVSSPAMWVKFVAAGLTDNDKGAATTVKVILTTSE